MIKISIPEEIPSGGSLKVIIHIGKLGFKRTEYYKKNEWAPSMEMYVDPETTSVSFESSTSPAQLTIPVGRDYAQ